MPASVSSYDDLRAMLEEQAWNACANAGLDETQISIDGYPFTQPDSTLWVQFSFEIGDTTPAELGVAARANETGKGRERTVGFYQFDVLIPENTGTSPAIAMCDALRGWFRYQQWLVTDVGYVNTASATPKSAATALRGWTRYTLRAAFDFWHDG